MLARLMCSSAGRRVITPRAFLAFRSSRLTSASLASLAACEVVALKKCTAKVGDVENLPKTARLLNATIVMMRPKKFIDAFQWLLALFSFDDFERRNDFYGRTKSRCHAAILHLR